MENQVDTFCNICASIGTVMQPDETIRVISAILTGVSILISIAYRVWKWYKDAKKDGVITPDELATLKDEIDDINKEIK